ncbi:MAG: hypothetical protein ACR2LI_04295 [Propionibacteriaceae bacterium]
MTARLGSWLRGFAAFWWDFVVGDDWRVAVGVVIALAATAVLAATRLPAWWCTPTVVLVVLGWSVRRGVRDARR